MNFWEKSEARETNAPRAMSKNTIGLDIFWGGICKKSANSTKLRHLTDTIHLLEHSWYKKFYSYACKIRMRSTKFLRNITTKFRLCSLIQKSMEISNFYNIFCRTFWFQLLARAMFKWAAILALLVNIVEVSTQGWFR
jgi:mRNA deadenylase 3'-5' endonuclease subunit Ccr4